MVRQNFLEFVLLKEQVDPKFALVEKRVNFLFDVNLKREEEDNKRCWIKVEGNEDAILRAKEYIIAVCSGLSLEEADIVWNENNNKLSSWQVDSSEKQTQSVECAEVATTDGETEKTTEEMVVISRNVVNKEDRDKSEISEKVREAGDSPASGESLRDFAKKLGYTDDTITTGLNKLGPLADTNSLLCELVKAQSSVKQLEEGSSTFSYEKPHQVLEDASCLRPIVIDGSNVAMSHGAQRVFSCRGIGLVVDWFLQRNHRDIKVFVPRWREKSSRPDSPIVDQEVLKRLERDRLLVWTPSRTNGKNRIVCYDDRYIIKHAAENDGVIVSNDNFRDLMGECHEWKKVIEQRLLMYSFVDDKFMPPDDPLGRHGPTLDEFLKKGCGKLCPYLRNCTYGKRCRYLHPDRNPVKEADVVPPSTEHLPPEVPYGQVTRPTRPLPPCPPEVPPHTRPLPSNAAQAVFQKPLPLPPYSEFTAELSRVFPPILRQGQAVGIGPRRSDPTPLPKELPLHVQRMEAAFQRTQSVPSVQDQACGGVPPGVVGPIMRRSSVPHVCHPPLSYSSPPGPPEIMVRGSMPLTRLPSDNGVVNGEWMLQEQMFGRHPYPYPGPFSSNPPVYDSHPPAPPVYDSHPPASLPLNHWNPLPAYPYDQQRHQYPAAPQQQYRHYGPGPPPFGPAGYGRTPYHGQCNGYMRHRSRAPPIIGGMCDDVTDNPGEGDDDSSHEELRIQAYEKLCELFPDDVEKVLKILDTYSDITSVETLTQHMLDDADD